MFLTNVATKDREDSTTANEAIEKEKYVQSQHFVVEYIRAFWLDFFIFLGPCEVTCLADKSVTNDLLDGRFIYVLRWNKWHTFYSKSNYNPSAGYIVCARELAPRVASRLPIDRLRSFPGQFYLLSRNEQFFSFFFLLEDWTEVLCFCKPTHYLPRTTIKWS